MTAYRLTPRYEQFEARAHYYARKPKVQLGVLGARLPRFIPRLIVSARAACFASVSPMLR